MVDPGGFQLKQFKTKEKMKKNWRWLRLSLARHHKALKLELSRA